jgi:hypothetical protein
VDTPEPSTREPGPIWDELLSAAAGYRSVVANPPKPRDFARLSKAIDATHKLKWGPRDSEEKPSAAPTDSAKVAPVAVAALSLLLGLALERSMAESAPIDMILFCPSCGAKHVDEPEPASGWANPPHKSHLCHGCGTIWRPASVPTNGVASITTHGRADTWPGK